MTVLCIIIFCVTITEITVKANNDFELLELDNENMEEEKSDTELFDEDLREISNLGIKRYRFFDNR